MPGTPKCAWCRALDTIAAFNLVQCLACGLHSTMDGEKAVPASEANEGVTVADIAPPEVTVAVAESTPDPVAAAAAATEPDSEGI